MLVVFNTARPESTLKKKSNSITYHFVRENAAMDVIRVAYEHTSTNLADCLTKTQSGTTRKRDRAQHIVLMIPFGLFQMHSYCLWKHEWGYINGWLSLCCYVFTPWVNDLSVPRRVAYQLHITSRGDCLRTSMVVLIWRVCWVMCP